MKDPRYNEMDSRSMRERLSWLQQSVWRTRVMRSGLVTVLVLAGVLIGLTVAYRAHMQGNFHKLKLKADLESERQDAPDARPGGQDPVVLLRTRMPGNSEPEFLSATLLPGRGMNVLQIGAYIPGRGEVGLLASPSLADAAAAMTGKGADAEGQASLQLGGVFEAPWADNLGAPPVVGGGSSATAWRGQTIDQRAATSGGAGAAAGHGLMLMEGADSVSTGTLPDGGTAEAVFHAGDFGGRWISKTDVTVSALLSGRAMELTVVATNVGDVAEPVGIGWRPRFAIAGDRAQARVRIPAASRVEVRDQARALPTGKLIPLAGTADDFSRIGGVAVGTGRRDDCLVDLQQKLLDNGPAAELIFPGSGYGLRMTALSPGIRAMRLTVPENGNYISIEPQYNYPDPFGKQWDNQNNTGMVVLRPGQSTEWKVRLELFLLSDPDPATNSAR